MRRFYNYKQWPTDKKRKESDDSKSNNGPAEEKEKYDLNADASVYPSVKWHMVNQPLESVPGFYRDSLGKVHYPDLKTFLRGHDENELAPLSYSRDGVTQQTWKEIHDNLRGYYDQYNRNIEKGRQGYKQTKGDKLRELIEKYTTNVPISVWGSAAYSRDLYNAEKEYPGITEDFNNFFKGLNSDFRKDNGVDYSITGRTYSALSGDNDPNLVSAQDSEFGAGVEFGKQWLTENLPYHKFGHSVTKVVDPDTRKAHYITNHTEDENVKDNNNLNYELFGNNCARASSFPVAWLTGIDPYMPHGYVNPQDTREYFNYSNGTYTYPQYDPHHGLYYDTTIAVTGENEEDKRNKLRTLTVYPKMFSTQLGQYKPFWNETKAIQDSISNGYIDQDLRSDSRALFNRAYANTMAKYGNDSTEVFLPRGSGFVGEVRPAFLDGDKAQRMPVKPYFDLFMNDYDAALKTPTSADHACGGHLYAKGNSLEDPPTKQSIKPIDVMLRGGTPIGLANLVFTGGGNTHPEYKDQKTMLGGITQNIFGGKSGNAADAVSTILSYLPRVGTMINVADFVWDAAKGDGNAAIYDALSVGTGYMRDKMRALGKNPETEYMSAPRPFAEGAYWVTNSMDALDDAHIIDADDIADYDHYARLLQDARERGEKVLDPVVITAPKKEKKGEKKNKKEDKKKQNKQEAFNR